MTWLSNASIDELGNSLIKNYMGDHADNNFTVDIEGFVTEYLKLPIKINPTTLIIAGLIVLNLVFIFCFIIYFAFDKINYIFLGKFKFKIKIRFK